MKFTKFIPALALALIVIVLPLSASANHSASTFSISPLQVPPNTTTPITISINNDIGQSVNSFVINMEADDATSGTITDCDGNWHTSDYGDGYTGYVVNATIPNAGTYSITCDYASTANSNSIVLDFYSGTDETGFIHSTGAYPQTVTADGTPSGGSGSSSPNLAVLNSSNTSSLVDLIWGFITDNVPLVLAWLAFIFSMALIVRFINSSLSGRIAKV